LLFVDADCNVDINGLAALSSAIARSPSHDVFQLRLVGNPANLVGRAVDLRLMTFQDHMLQSDGRVRCLNTAELPFVAQRRTCRPICLIPPALRVEDIFMVDLMQAGELPLVVPDAVVEHAIPLSLLECLRKDIRSAFTEKRAYDIIAAKGIRIRLTHRERLRLLRILRKTAGQPAIGRLVFFLLVARQTIKRVISLGLNLFGGFAGRP
jgi:hypothetical protein